jgi:hypothetical protein
MSKNLIDLTLNRAKDYAEAPGADSSGVIRGIEVALEANDITEGIYWQMLRDLEGHMRADDVLGKMLVKSAYNHWNRLHPNSKPMVPCWEK